MILRTKTFAEYRVKAIKLLREYAEFEKLFLGEKLDKLFEMQKSKAIELIKKKVKKGLTEVTEDELKKEIEKNADQYIELSTLTQDIESERLLCQELFLSQDTFEKAKILNEIWYEDYQFPVLETEEDYRKFMAETLEVFRDFFLKHSKPIRSGIDSMSSQSLNT
jgi:hypothetical protein